MIFKSVTPILTGSVTVKRHYALYMRVQGGISLDDAFLTVDIGFPHTLECGFSGKRLVIESLAELPRHDIKCCDDGPGGEGWLLKYEVS